MPGASTLLKNTLLVFLASELVQGEDENMLEVPTALGTCPYIPQLQNIQLFSRPLDNNLNFLSDLKEDLNCTEQHAPSKKTSLVSRVVKGYAKSLKF